MLRLPFLHQPRPGLSLHCAYPEVCLLLPKHSAICCIFSFCSRALTEPVLFISNECAPLSLSLLLLFFSIIFPALLCNKLSKVLFAFVWLEFLPLSTATGLLPAMTGRQQQFHHSSIRVSCHFCLFLSSSFSILTGVFSQPIFSVKVSAD